MSMLNVPHGVGSPSHKAVNKRIAMMIVVHPQPESDDDVLFCVFIVNEVVTK